MSRISIFKKKPKAKEEIEVSLDIPESVKSNAFWNICRLEDYYVISSILKSCGADAVPFWDAIRSCLESDGVLLYILKQHIIDEVKKTKEKPQLFRVNGGITHLMSSFMKKEGKLILENYVNPIIKVVNDLPNVLEVDNVKAPQEEVDKNVQTLLTLIKDHVCKFDLLSSLISPNLSFMFNIIKQEVIKKWPENGLIAIGGFLFLRFLNPAIVSPQRFGSSMILPNENGHRTLILISKVVQAIANQPLCPFREEFMAPFSDYVLSQYNIANEFLSSISSNSEMPNCDRDIGDSVIIESVPTIIKGVLAFKEDVVKEFHTYLDGVPGLKEKLLPMLETTETIKKFTFTDQNAALNEVMFSMKKSILEYEREINQLNGKIIDLYIKLGSYLPECGTLPEITYKVQENKLKKIEELRNKRESENNGNETVTVIQPNRPSLSTSTEQQKKNNSNNEVIIEDLEDELNERSEDSEKESLTDSEEWSESDSEIFITGFKETYKKKIEQERTSETTPNKAMSLSVSAYKKMMEEKLQVPEDLMIETRGLIHLIHKLMHMVHKCDNAKQLYHVSLELIISVQKMSGKENVNVHHKDVECDNSMIPKTKDLIERLIKIIEDKLRDDPTITLEYLQKAQGYLNETFTYLKK